MKPSVKTIRPPQALANEGSFLDNLEIPRTLADIGVPASCAAALAEKAFQDAAALTNPRTTTVVEIQAVIEDTLNNGR